MLLVGHDEVSDKMPKKTTPKKTTKTADEQFRLVRSPLSTGKGRRAGFQNCSFNFYARPIYGLVRGKANAKIRLPQSTEQMKCRKQRKIEGVEEFERKELAPQT